MPEATLEFSAIGALKAEIARLDASLGALTKTVQMLANRKIEAGEVVTATDVSPIDRAMSKKWSNAALLDARPF